MIRKLHNRSRIIAGVFGTSLMAAFVCDYLCDVGIIEFENASHHQITESSTDHDQSPHDDDHTHFFDFLITGNDQSKNHEHTESQEHRESHDHNGDHQHSQGEDDACCEDEMNNLFFGLISKTAPDFHFDQAFIFTVSFCYQDLLKETLDSQTTFAYIDPAPPPWGPDIRVAIQSFLL